MSSAWRVAVVVHARAGVGDHLTATPASAAASAVDSTQQSVDTPASTSRAAAPTRSASSGPHLLNVVASTVGPASRGELVHQLVDAGASGGCSANGHCS